MKVPSSTDKVDCMVCGTGGSPQSPKRKVAVCSKECYDQMQKAVLVYGETLQRQQDEAKKREDKK